jgi:hypothetical protein
MRKLFSLLISSILVATTLVAITSTQASAAPTLTTCTNLETGKTLVLRSADAQCRNHLGSALWVQEQSDSPSRTGDGYATITVCSSKSPLSTYRFIKDSCPKFQVTTNYWRAIATPATPIIEAASASGHDSAALIIKLEKSAISAPITYYLVTDTKSGQIRKVLPGNLGRLNISGLSSESSYIFTITAVNVDGTSTASLTTPVIRTGTAPVVATTAPVALTCATGGTCVVGDTGPGGGIVFYVSTTPFACGPTRTATCKYLEAAPNGWNGGGDPSRSWATDVNSNRTTSVPAPGALQTAIGTGFQNSDAIVAQTGNVAASSAAVVARAYIGTGLTDWYLPSSDELNQMCKWVRGQAWTSDATVCNNTGALNSGLGAAGFAIGSYYSSSEWADFPSWHFVLSRSFNNGGEGAGAKSGINYIRPVRAF